MLDLVRRILMHPRFVPGCFAVYCVTRAAMPFLFPLQMGSDAAWYLNRAESIAAGQGYAEGGYPTAYWPIGYPGLLGVLFWLFGPHVLIGQLANVVFAIASFPLLLGLGRYLFRDELTARAAVALLTLYPNQLGYVAVLWTETFFVFLVLLGSYLFFTRRSVGWTILTGVIFGVAALTKPQFVFFPAFLLALRWLSTSSFGAVFRQGVFLYTLMAVLLVPWAVRNTLAFGTVVLVSTNGGATLLTGNHPNARGGYSTDHPLVDQIKFTVKDQVAADRRARALATQWIRENPERFVALIPLKIWHLWAKDGESEWAFQEGYSKYEQYKVVFRGIRWANQFFYAALLLGCAISIAMIRRMRREVEWPSVLIGYIVIAYVTMISIAFSGQSRYHFPAMPWVILYSAWVLSVWLRPPLANRQN